MVSPGGLRKAFRPNTDELDLTLGGWVDFYQVLEKAQEQVGIWEGPGGEVTLGRRKSMTESRTCETDPHVGSSRLECRFGIRMGSGSSQMTQCWQT